MWTRNRNTVHRYMLLFSLLPFTVFAQKESLDSHDSLDSKRRKEFFADMDSAEATLQESSTPMVNDSTADTELTVIRNERITSIRAEYKYHREYLDYWSFSLANRRRMLVFQYYSKIVTFGLVIIIVLSGLVFSALQFLQAFIIHKITSTPGQSAAGTPQTDAAGIAQSTPTTAPPQTQLELSLSGVKITSSVIGLLILIVSIAFFYLYVQVIYPITEIDNGSNPKTSLDTSKTQ